MRSVRTIKYTHPSLCGNGSFCNLELHQCFFTCLGYFVRDGRMIRGLVDAGKMSFSTRIGPMVWRITNFKKVYLRLCGNGSFCDLELGSLALANNNCFAEVQLHTVRLGSN